jgi:hypothetical protein
VEPNQQQPSGVQQQQPKKNKQTVECFNNNKQGRKEGRTTDHHIHFMNLCKTASSATQRRHKPKHILTSNPISTPQQQQRTRNLVSPAPPQLIHRHTS